MPQLDLATYIPQIFWLVISFFVLFFILSKIFIPLMARQLDRRETSLKTILEDAQLTHDSWKKEQEQQNKKLAAAREKMDITLKDLEKDLRYDFQRDLENLTIKLEDDYQRFSEKVTQQQKKEIGELADLVAQQIPTLTKKFTDKGVSEDVVEEVTKTLLEEMQKEGHRS